jgi:hypothetical protein
MDPSQLAARLLQGNLAQISYAGQLHITLLDPSERKCYGAQLDVLQICAEFANKNTCKPFYCLEPAGYCNEQWTSSFP